MENRCVCCGIQIPEGRMVCYECEDIEYGTKQICPKDCPGRTVGCHGRCERWVKHSKDATEDYKARALASETADAIHRIRSKRFSKSDHDVVRRRIR